MAAKPDCDDGWLKYAHELDAALAVADFTKGARIVLREVFSQIFGPAKLRHAKLSPAEIGGRVGMARSHVMRGITELVDSGVLARSADGSYKFIKDYESWTYKGARRLSEAEVVYCHSAPKISLSYMHTPIQNALPDEVTHQQSPVTNPGNTDVKELPNEVTDVTQRGNTLLPNEVTDFPSPYRNGRELETLRIENSRSLAPACEGEGQSIDPDQSRLPDARDPEDSALVREAITLLGSSPNTEQLGMEVGRVHNSATNVRLAGWRWVVAAYAACESSGHVGDGPMQWKYFFGIVKGARRSEYDKIRAGSAPDPGTATLGELSRLPRKQSPAERRRAESEAIRRAVAAIPEDPEES
jgi:hypothetical protein